MPVEACNHENVIDGRPIAVSLQNFCRSFYCACVSCQLGKLSWPADKVQGSPEFQEISADFARAKHQQCHLLSNLTGIDRERPHTKWKSSWCLRQADFYGAFQLGLTRK